MQGPGERGCLDQGPWGWIRKTPGSAVHDSDVFNCGGYHLLNP